MASIPGSASIATIIISMALAVVLCCGINGWRFVVRRRAV
jgi:hypothetical protein